ncbi:Translation initiation factor eIF-2B subunit alpha-like Protein [Tribolium castaneum]|uniref:Translation initiation factor eIF2B subunit alpha n=1 Tax=Tribolium castaneum TaxID=7070 RepID=D6X539_TRICA|nr:PREDICTED: translation initiation factor eIF-2B subunit alpha [Tribolium castaneum]EEZ97197.1 Translation initiation factor eIF-2B subunit alpha-like Protein [Tribolium castaneum]|eukprot:XP_971498.1 PREDICTED: translation initiation factor eIF-2B subunit alpha [Tribolium castaneum]
MDKQEVKAFFDKTIAENEDLSVGVVAIMTLMKIIEKYQDNTVQGLDENLKLGILAIKTSDYPVTAINSGCELFMRFITLAKLDYNSFEQCRNVMLERGNIFLNRLKQCRAKIVKLATKFIADGSKVLTHSRSRVVLQTLIEASRQGKQFEIYVTKSAPDNSGDVMCKNLTSVGIPCTLILDSAIGYVMEQVDFVMVGAEGVVESGGIVNKVGSYTMAVCAKEMKKPFYVLTESFKFSRLFPLNQGDLPPEYKYSASARQLDERDFKKIHPLVDYTPPFYITLLFTDLGILTPSAVSDELIKLYL